MTFITTEDDDPLATESGLNIVTDGPVIVIPYIQQFDFEVDLLDALLWQYNEASNLQSILNAKQSWYDTNQTDFWDNWIQDVFNLTTANEFGLSVWSIILDFPLFVNVAPSPAGKPTWGFGANRMNFGNGNFTTLSGGTNLLSDAAKKLALQLRYFQLCSSGTVPEINRFLRFLFGAGNAYLVDNLDMTQQFVFNFVLPGDYVYLFDNFDILPRPATVQSSYVQA